MDKRLLRFAGGQPVRSQDIEFLQDALNGATTNLAKAFGDTYILYGAVDEERNNVIEGAVVIDGEVYTVPALGALDSNKLCYRAIDSDERNFYNGQPHKVVRTYEAYLSEDTESAVAWIDLKTAKEPVKEINSRLDNMFTSELSGWQSVQLVEGFDGSVSYIYPFLGNCIAVKINVNFSKYNPEGNNAYAAIFKEPIPHDFGIAPIVVNTGNWRGVQGGIPAAISPKGGITNSAEGPIKLTESLYSGYSINSFFISPVNE